MPLTRALLAVAFVLAAAPAEVHAEYRGDLRLLDTSLSLAPVGWTAPAARPDLEPRPLLALVAEAADGKAAAGKPERSGEQAAKPAAPAPGALDFDLLGDAEAPADAPDLKALRLRRKMLEWHQGLGMGLLALDVGTLVVGQLNYNDKFGGTAPANTGRYRLTHAGFAYTGLGVFAVNGVLALFAPSPNRKLQMDRVMVHRIAMATAAVGMIAQAVYGIRTAGREGYLDQEEIARNHLILGYVTVGAQAIGVGALTF